MEKKFYSLLRKFWRLDTGENTTHIILSVILYSLPVCEAFLKGEKAVF